jgi:hypothetical protein
MPTSHLRLSRSRSLQPPRQWHALLRLARGQRPPSATMTLTTCSCSNERSIKYTKRSLFLRDDIRGENGGQLAFDDRAYRASTGALTRRQTRVFVGSRSGADCRLDTIVAKATQSRISAEGTQSRYKPRSSRRKQGRRAAPGLAMVVNRARAPGSKHVVTAARSRRRSRQQLGNPGNVVGILRLW